MYEVCIYGDTFWASDTFMMTNYDQKSHFLLKEEQPTLERTSMEVFTYLKSNGQHEKKFKNVWKVSGVVQ